MQREGIDPTTFGATIGAVMELYGMGLLTKEQLGIEALFGSARAVAFLAEKDFRGRSCITTSPHSHPANVCVRNQPLALIECAQEAIKMQAFYPERFERKMGCTEPDWLRWLPQAVGEHHWKLQAGTAGVRIGDGALGLKWQAAAPRVIGLIHIPVLRVHFRFAGVDEAQRQVFMKRFDLCMQRGGG